jgi:hypothetical protein
MGRGKGVLHGVLGFLGRPEHVATEAEDRWAVALERDLEGGLVPAPDLFHEPLVSGQREQPPRATWPGGSRAGLD